ncbi:hypothetical protein BGZ49_004443 [Haplosporangium sp. Z 27]|nr:hypothetical protein BGZ49_004443 [Haplosporangium sp. Z 27]
MAVCLSKKEYERRTYIKQIDEFTLACDRNLYLNDQSELDPEEEAEALKILNEVLAFFKEHLFLHSLRKTTPVRVRTKSGKDILFTVSDAYWDAWKAELERRAQEDDEKEEEEERAKNAANEVQL